MMSDDADDDVTSREAEQERTLGSGLACRERAGPAKMSSSRRTEELAGNSLLGERPASQKERESVRTRARPKGSRPTWPAVAADQDRT